MTRAALPGRLRSQMPPYDQIALITWAERVQIGDRSLADWLIYVPSPVAETEAGRMILRRKGGKNGVPGLLLPIRTSRYSSGWWELNNGGRKPDASQIERFAMLRAGGCYVAIYAHWHECSRDVLRYLSHGDLPVVVRDTDSPETVLRDAV